ncbi:uncharacterized protein VTP21DRAFT_11687 [Calcarisporiella thermophila]|uniref:uncharacterized protein n=1 Tax=Calcarisporiella thermophila TaxID=911321 RepID=UPI003743ACC8
MHQHPGTQFTIISPPKRQSSASSLVAMEPTPDDESYGVRSFQTLSTESDDEYSAKLSPPSRDFSTRATTSSQEDMDEKRYLQQKKNQGGASVEDDTPLLNQLRRTLISCPTTPGSPLSISSLPVGDENVPGMELDQLQSGFESCLVMPTLTIAEAKHPTNEGQNLGYMRVLVCGDTGIGKTQLIHTLMGGPDILASDIHESSGGVANLLYASTMVLPPWLHSNNYPDHDRNSVLVKNICFVDTVGYGTHLDAKLCIAPIVDYVIQQFKRTNGFFSESAPNGPELARFLTTGSGGHTHVDACLYLILHRLKPVDIEYMRSLHHVVNLIPIIVKADTISSHEVAELKQKVLHDLREHGIQFFDFGCASPNDANCPPFAVSTMVSEAAPLEEGVRSVESISSQPPNPPLATLPSSHHESPNPQPNLFPQLHSSELSKLYTMLFHTHVNFLRQATADKFVEWRRTHRSTFTSASTTVADSQLSEKVYHDGMVDEGRPYPRSVTEAAAILMRSSAANPRDPLALHHPPITIDDSVVMQKRVPPAPRTSPRKPRSGSKEYSLWGIWLGKGMLMMFAGVTAACLYFSSRYVSWPYLGGSWK